ncbi:MAG TPA: PPOX class F420-dependent oxidoreductase [Ktedonobacterales bacterium]
MAFPMSDADARSFLAEGTRTATVCTIRADGRPHAAPVWFALDGADVIFTTTATTMKARNLQRDPRVCICVDDDRAPYAYVVVEGTAALADDPKELLRWATIIAARYVGDDQAEAFGERYSVPGELLVRVTPRKITAEAGIID